MMTYRKADVRMHSDGFGPRRPAVNVKVHAGLEAIDWDAVHWEAGDDAMSEGWLREHLSDDALQGWWDVACGLGFEQARQDAREIFGSHVNVYSEGRSGGWIVVDGIPDLEDWDAVMLGKWRRFERAARETADDIPTRTALLIAINVYPEWRKRETTRDALRLLISRTREVLTS